MNRRILSWAVLAAVAVAGRLPAAESSEAAPAPTSVASQKEEAGKTPRKRAERVQRKVTLDLKEVPLHEAIRLLFEGVESAVVVPGTVPNNPVTLKIQDMDFEAALTQLLRVGSTPTRRVTFQWDGGAYQIIPLSPPGTPKGPERVHLFRLRFADAVSVRHALLPEVRASGISSLVPVPQENSLLVRGTEPAIKELEALITQLDTPMRQEPLLFRVEIRGKLDGKNVHFTDSIRSVPGTEATVEEGTRPGRGSRYKITLSAKPEAPTTYRVTHNWEISLPLTGGSGPVQLEKRIAATTSIRSGETLEVGRVNAAQWGGTGELTLYLTLQAPQ